MQVYTLRHSMPTAGHTTHHLHTTLHLAMPRTVTAHMPLNAPQYTVHYWTNSPISALQNLQRADSNAGHAQAIAMGIAQVYLDAENDGVVIVAHGAAGVPAVVRAPGLAPRRRPGGCLRQGVAGGTGKRIAEVHLDRGGGLGGGGGAGAVAGVAGYVPPAMVANTGGTQQVNSRLTAG
jgi:hypothetical protein